MQQSPTFITISVGLIFYSTHFTGKIEVLGINEAANTLQVRIIRSEEHSHEEEWNLEHAQIGFNKGEYYPNKPPKSIERKIGDSFF